VRVVFGEFYRDERIFETAKILGMDLVELKPEADESGAPPA